MHTELILIDDDPISLLLSKFMIQKVVGAVESFRFKIFEVPVDGLGYVTHLINDRKVDKSRLKILLDINMPAVDGWRFLDLLDRIDPEKKVKVIMHSSSKDLRDISMALSDSRVLEYIPKPMDSKSAFQISDVFKLGGCNFEVINGS